MQCPTPRAETDSASPTHKQVRIARHIIVRSITYGLWNVLNIFLLYLLACSITLYLVILHAIYIEFTVVIFTLIVYSGYSFYMDCY